MLKTIINILRKIVVAFLLLYGLNLLISSLNICIPINAVTLTVVSILGVPGLASLIIMFFIVQ